MRTTEITRRHRTPLAALASSLAILALAVTLAAGCKHAAAPAQQTDQQLTASVQSRLQGESALSGQNIQVSVAGGVATLSGAVSDDASRALAGNDAGSVSGVRTVVNNLTVQPAQQAAAAAATQPAAAPAPSRNHNDRTRDRDRSRYAGQKASNNGPDDNGANLPPADAENAAQAAPVQQAAMPHPAPPSVEQPVARQVVLPAGTEIPIRLTDTLDTKTAQPNDVFHASIAQDVVVHGLVAIPRGATVLGRVVDVHEATHFKGKALLSLQLTEIRAHGQQLDIDTDTFSREGKARGKNTAEKTGGGALFGAIVGAIAGGGKGAAIGALAGGGAGAGINAVTRGQQIQLPPETLLDFHLQDQVPITLTILPSGKVANTPENGPQLQHR
ncbi:MAG TPA: BON domain-containing protein [Terracidiphilus sp.]|nr:BON domain-containing protein [Terracidiphilus sp.]